MAKAVNLFIKERGFRENYVNVTRRRNIHVKLGDKDILFFIQDRDQFRTFYITTDPKQQRIVQDMYYPEDIIYVPNLFHDLKKLDKIDKVYIHAFLLKFFAENENKSGYNWYESNDYIMTLYQSPDWQRISRILKKRYPEFSEFITQENILEWLFKISGRRWRWPEPTND
ncbi:hypothetical protein [Mycoplasma procyoni]|uniref:hypothetical protein n=1 Tax=Mycoplasma procyoni TaxID=568784 RepID=UPI00197B3A1C|nr:hypothetical protein [Mycoplasma procyoni]MBN3534698.1 hypothetical protein [Mycoplasma procyoni]